MSIYPIYIDSSTSGAQLSIGTVNASSVIIGNTNSTTTIQGLPIISMAGLPLVAYNVSTGVNANIPTGIEFGSVVENNTNQGGKAFIDFHTNQKGFVDYDARIMAAGGSTVTPATTQAASLNYYAGSHYFAGNVNMGSGSTVENGLIVKSYSSATIGQITFNNTHNAGGANFYVGHDSYTSGNFVIKVGGGQGVYLVAGGTGWTGYSDIRLKKNIEPIENSLEKICNITPIYFEYIKSDISMNYVGFSAQEVETQFPIIVTDDENGVKMIQPTSFIPYLVQSIKELKYENDNLKQKNYDHQEKITSLQTQLSSVLQRLESAGL